MVIAHCKKIKYMKNRNEEREAYRGIILISVFEVLALLFFHAIN